MCASAAGAHACPRLPTPAGAREAPRHERGPGLAPGDAAPPGIGSDGGGATGPQEQGYGKPLPAALTTNLKLL